MFDQYVFSISIIFVKLHSSIKKVSIDGVIIFIYIAAGIYSQAPLYIAYMHIHTRTYKVNTYKLIHAYIRSYIRSYMIW